MTPAGKRWLISGAAGLGVALLVIAGVVTSVRLKTPAQNSAKPAPGELTPAMVLASGKGKERDRQALRDLEPLFFPTRHNASVVTYPARKIEDPGTIAGTFPPKDNLVETGVAFPEPIATPATPVEALAVGEQPNPFAEFGRTDLAPPALPARLAYIEVADTRTGRLAISEAVPATPALQPPASDWAPLQLMIAIDAMGLVSAPARVGPAVSEDVENFFRNLVARHLHLGARLEPGFYTVRIGP